MEMVRVGNVGNAPDPATGGQYGRVDYVYAIGKYLVTNHEYSVFLNQVAHTADPHGLYNPEMGTHSHGGIVRTGEAGNYSYAPKPGWENRPVNFVSFRMAARFANWLSNGQGRGSTENGAYDMSKPITTMVRSNRSPGKYFIATENEWYKAAYHDPTLNGGEGGYWAYATRSNTEPINQAPPGDESSANFGNNPNYITDVGAYVLSRSFYGTYDQEGNLAEFTETIASGGRVRRSSSYWNNLTGSGFRTTDDPDTTARTIGFRIVACLEGTDIAYWDFNEVAPGDVIPDRAGEADARIIGGIAADMIQPGIYGNAVYFDGESNHSHLRVNPGQAPTLENDFTIHYVIKPYKVDGYRTILWKGNRRVDPQEVSYYSNIRDGRIEFKFMDETGEWVNYTTSTILQENQWYRIFIRFHNGSVRINVNGVDRSVTVINGGPAHWHLHPNDHPPYIGQGASVRGARDYFFHGLIDELRITYGDAVDVSPAATQEWNQRLNDYPQKWSEYLQRKNEEAALREATLASLYRDVFVRKTSTPEAPFAVVSLPSTRRFVRNRDYLLELNGLSRDIVLSAAGNEYEGVQLIVLGNPDLGTASVGVAVSDLIGPDGVVFDSGNVEWGWLKDVITEAPDIAVDFVGPIPDVIIDDDETFAVPMGDFVPLFVRVKVPEGTKAGVYKGTVTLSSEGFSEEIPIYLRVLGFALPEKGTLRTAFSFSEAYYRNWLGVGALSDAQKRGIMDFLLKYRLSPVDIYSSKPLDPEAGLLDEIKNRTNFVSIMLWGNGILEGEALAEKMAQYEQIVGEIQGIGIEEDVYFYGADELSVNMDGLPAATQASQMLGQAYPWLKRMQTSFPIPELRELYNVWVPLFNEFIWPANLEVLRELKEEGAEIWWYAADDPLHPLPNYFLDYPVFDSRIIMTLSHLYGVDGILYWRINREWETNMDIRQQWPNAEWKPYFHHSTYGTRKMKNGAGNLVYPGKMGGLHASLRLENVRDGLEDYEYLVLLEQVVEALRDVDASHPALEMAERLLEVPREVAASIDNYNRDPRALMDYRNHVGWAIEWINGVLDGNTGGPDDGYPPMVFYGDPFPAPLVFDVSLTANGEGETVENILWLLSSRPRILVRPGSLETMSVGDRFAVAVFPDGFRAEDYLPLFELHPDYVSLGWGVHFESAGRHVWLVVHAVPGAPPPTLSAGLGVSGLPVEFSGAGNWGIETHFLYRYLVEVTGIPAGGQGFLETVIKGPGVLRFRMRRGGTPSIYSGNATLLVGGDASTLWVSEQMIDYAVNIPAGDQIVRWAFGQSAWSVSPEGTFFQVADLRFEPQSFPSWDWWRQVNGCQDESMSMSPLLHYALGIPLHGGVMKEDPILKVTFERDPDGQQTVSFLTYSRPTGLQDVEYRVEYSTDMITWHPADGFVPHRVERRPDGLERVTLKGDIVLAESGVLFFRILVSVYD